MPEEELTKSPLKPKLILGAGLLLAFAAGWLVRTYWPVQAGSPLEISDLNRIYQLLQKKYDGQLDQAKLIEGAKAGFVAAAGDPYTTYLSPKAAKALDDDLHGTLSGIGAEIGVKQQRLQVVAPIDDSPAAKAGLLPGDLILEINGKDTSNMALDEAVSKIRGEAGTKVKLRMARSGREPFEVSITRQVITVKSVKWEVKVGGIGYIQLTRFAADTPELMAQAARELRAQNVRGVVLDMRNNPGGYLDGAVKVAGHFVENKLVVEQRRGHKSIEKLSTNGQGTLVGIPLVILINEGSASASEIVAGALQDHGVARLVGQTTFGKGSVQELDQLRGGAQLKITVAHWYTPGGRNITKEGIKPDVKVELVQADYDNNRDPQLDKALELLR